MPRPRTHTKTSLAASAMEVFWMQGYNATSLDDLVNATGVSRHGIYGDFGGKRELFLASLDHYREAVVTPAFEAVEADRADLTAVAGYFEHQIQRAEELGLPGRGCLMANTMTEVAPRDDEVRKLVSAHADRLRCGFANALRNEAGAKPVADLEDVAQCLAVFTQGLWSASRVTDDAESLRRSVALMLSLVAARIEQ
ncbi:MAG: helix-turn-helix domain-containing protein [Pseudomonadota bacterium]